MPEDPNYKPPAWNDRLHRVLDVVLARHRCVEVNQVVVQGDLKWITITLKLKLEEAETLFLPPA